MRQAIEEGFIMDVLQNYTTYKRFFGLIKQVENDPDVPRKQAAKALTRYLELHPYNIEQVVSVIVEHFRLHVMHELGGRAKAMVVTGSRLAAVKYKLAFDRYITEQGLHWHPLAGRLLRHGGRPGRPRLVLHRSRHERRDLPRASCPRPSSATSIGCCWSPRSTRPASTSRSCRRCTWSSGSQACRRCRRCRASTARRRARARTFVLDFANEEEDIYKAFKPYYEATPIGENADPHRL